MEGLAAVVNYAKPAVVGALSVAAGMTPQTAAVMAVATYAIENMPRVAAGPLLYKSCVYGCSLMAPPFIPLCVAGCLPLLAVPSP